MTSHRSLALILMSLFISCIPCLAQHVAVAPEARYYRVICLVHLTGSGKHKDPVRPEYVPSTMDSARAGIVSWSMQPTDDKNMAILHLVATNRKALAAILDDKRGEVRVFEVGKDRKDSIETEMRRYKKDFSLDKFRVVAR